MALGKLWNTFFGKRAAAESEIPRVAGADESTRANSASPSHVAPNAAASIVTASVSVPAPVRAAEEPGVGRPSAPKVKRKAGRRVKSEPAVEQAPAAEVPQRQPIRIAAPRTNAWTRLVSGRSIGSILDTNLGDASRAVEVLEAIVCDAVPTPKYVAIDQFDLGQGPLTVMEFHQRIRRVGGQPVAIPGDLPSGLRQLSQTLGAVDLVLLDGPGVDLTQLDLHRLLTRVTHSGSLVLHRDASGRWQPLPIASSAASRPSGSKTQAA